MYDEPRAIDLEVYELIDDAPNGIIKPGRIRINGVECLTPERKPAVIEGLMDGYKGDGLTVTLTLYVRSLTVHAQSSR
jgi:hypothetical protein